ncbi:hypothetical protein [Saccharopolyspora taberi]|uniref:XRE family transcriptional regulator n=1 Tax=Saccharopolyspora taberi TaxID=60895 RepID=A0ABN3V052_9PSEU
MTAATRESSRAELDALLRSGPFHLALRAAIEHSGLTLEALRVRLARRGIKLSLASLSYWQHGRSRPERTDSLRALRVIEHILDLPAQSLTALLGPPRPRGRWTQREAGYRRYDGILEPAAPLTQAIEPVLGPSDRQLRVFSQEDVVTVGPDRTIRRIRTRAVLRSLEQGADRYLAVLRGEPGSDPAALVPAARQNCRLGRVSRHSASPVVVAELLFDRELRAGETHLLEYEFRLDSPVPSHDHRRGFRYPADSYVASVHFDVSAMPARCHRFRREPFSAERVESELPITRDRSVHLAARDVPRGVMGVSWRWD